MCRGDVVIATDREDMVQRVMEVTGAQCSAPLKHIVPVLVFNLCLKHSTLASLTLLLPPED